MDLDSFLYAACDAALGIEIETNNPEGLKRKLYRHRKKLQEEKNITFFDSLQVITSPILPDTRIWIINKKQTESPSKTLKETS